MFDSMFIMLLAFSAEIMANFKESLKMMGSGMLGIMVVILILTIIVSIISYFDNKKPKDKKDDKSK